MNSTEMAVRKQQSVEVQDTEQQAEAVEAGYSAGSPSATADEIQRSATKYEDDVAGKSRVYNESTHKYLVYFAHDRSINGFIIGVGSFSLQLALFFVMFSAGREAIDEVVNLSNGVPVHVQDTFGEACYEVDTDYIWRTPNGTVWSSSFKGVQWLNKTALPTDDTTGLMSCGADPLAAAKAFDDLGTTLLQATGACVLMAAFLLEDMLSCLKALLSVPGIWAKIVSLSLFCLNLFAFYIGTCFAVAGLLSGSPYDALANCVGVLFVNDIDEKMYAAASIIDKTEMKAGRGCTKYARSTCIIFSLLIMIVVGLVFSFISLSIEVGFFE